MKPKPKSKRTPDVIAIRFKGVGQTRIFHPGDTVEGFVEINPTEPTDCRSIEIKIGWHTDGRGDRDEGIFDFIELPVEQLDPTNPISEPFSITLPASPWSYEGDLIRVVWAVEVKVDIPWATDYNATEEFVLQPADPT